MFPRCGNLYVQWRARLNQTGVLHEERGLPSERLLQAVWLHQRLRRDQLRTLDGNPVKVFHPGFASVEGGPDFRGAVVQIGDHPPQTGDIEVDLRAGNWHAHGHDRNPNFQNVVLHVIWDEVGIHPVGPSKDRTLDPARPSAQASPPRLAIGDKLDAPVHELSLWLESESPPLFPDDLRGQCCAPLRELDETQLAALLRAAAAARFQAKAAWFRARAQLAGWEQSLWEGLFRALGYKHNGWPMQHLAETRPHWISGARSILVLQARLFGVSGLLPPELPRTVGKDYLRRIWDCWWRERDQFTDCTLPRAAWRFHGLRPANHPLRRLALAAHWLGAGDLVPRLERWCAMDLTDKKLPASLREIFEVKQDEFWSWHWTLRSARLKKPQPLLGASRVTDLTVNVVLPWLWARAMEGKNCEVQHRLERRYLAWPSGQDNSVLRLARQRLLTSNRDPQLWREAAVQQGLMQITQDFCAHSNAVCDGCHFPELANGWRGQAITAHLFSQTDCS